MPNDTTIALRPRFKPGHIAATPGANELLQGDMTLAAKIFMSDKKVMLITEFLKSLGMRT